VTLKMAVQMMRIGDWIRFYPAFPLAGACLSGCHFTRTALVLALYIIMIGYAFAVNNYFDAEIDQNHKGKHNSGKNPLAMGWISLRDARRVLEGLIIVSLIMMMAIGWMAGGWQGPALALLNLLLLTAYSGGPRLKEIPGADLTAHGLMFGALPVACGFYLGGGSASWLLVLASSVAFLLGAEALVAHQMVDFREDFCSTKTTVVSIGQARGGVLLAFLAFSSAALVAAAAWSALIPLHYAWPLIAYLLSYPVFSVRKVRDELRQDIRDPAIPQ